MSEALHDNTWDSASSDSWARTLGLVSVPMFNSESFDSADWTDRRVLVDGQAGSMGFCVAAPDTDLLEEGPLQWAWSANLPHALIVAPHSEEVLWRRWDTRRHRRFRLPKAAAGAEDLFKLLRGTDTPEAVDVITHMLRAFRLLRDALGSSIAPQEVVRVFNLLLVSADAADQEKLTREEIRSCETVGDLVELDIATETSVANAGSYSTRVLGRGIEDSAEYFLCPEPTTSLVLKPSLLLRHAVGQLYQEAHLELEERERRQRELHLPGMGSGHRREGRLKRDVRFTPTNLARALVEEAFRAYGYQKVHELESIGVLDPACGSGVFLLEFLRELRRIEYEGNVTVRGFDISEVSCAMARFCAGCGVRDFNAWAGEQRASLTIENRDALSDESWGDMQMVIMNPPFVSWNNMDEDRQDLIKGILGDAYQRRPNAAMAFVTKAVGELCFNGVLASVLPGPVLDNQSGLKWREQLEAKTEKHFLARFQGYGLFRSSLVEPACVVLQRQSGGHREGHPVRALVVQESHADEAIRGMRKTQTSRMKARRKGWDMYEVPAHLHRPESWLPHSPEDLKLMLLLEEARTPYVSELFDVHQGVLTGRNDAFLLPEKEYRELTDTEKDRYFRPVAGRRTIGNCQIERNYHLFYPYDSDGLMLLTEEAVRDSLPEYYDKKLRPWKGELLDRAGISEDSWWELTRSRTWQHQKQPKLVSAYRGRRGDFAYDDRGDFVVLQGYGWLWTGDCDAFVEIGVPWCYISILNSTVFERLLECYCPSVQGGQFDLSVRFVEDVPLPDLTDEDVSGDVVRGLASLGESMSQGKKVDPDNLDKLVLRAYRVPAIREFL